MSFNVACFVLAACLNAYTLPKVVVFSTGGTISGRHDPARGGYLPAATGDELVAAVPKLKDIAEFQVEQITAINSADMTAEIWLQLANRLQHVLEEPSVTGAIITHGTNTLEETAYFLDLVLTSVKPVILVGAQRPASDPYSDGPLNLLRAVEVAVNPDARGKGTLVVMNEQIHAARDVTKLHSNRVETFRSLEFGAIGIADRMGVKFYRAPLQRQTIPITAVKALPRVDIVVNYAGVDGELVRSLMATGKTQGLVVAGFGGGTVAGSMFEAIKEARAKGLPVVITGAPTGRIYPSSASPGSVLMTRRIGCVLAHNLSPQKARILLMLAMTHTRQPSALQAYFDW
ncbi:MAG TPA: asparaginase [Bryobacteraceae bacterium]|nr:asparaginase [Bryobacteraceae bacterium]